MSNPNPNTLNDAIQQRFGSTAANYRKSTVHAGGEDLQAMLDCARLEKHFRVLDAGCGAGHTAAAFAPHVAEVVAYDLTAPMLEQVTLLAMERGLSNIRTQQGTVDQLPFAAGSFDLVVSRYSAHHWAQPQAALVEFARVLKPGGQFILSDIVAPPDLTQDTFLQTFELLRDTSHVRDHSVGQWQALFMAAGFTAQTVLNFRLNMHYGEWITRMQTPETHNTVIKALFAGAPQEVKAAFGLPDAIISDDFRFEIIGAVLTGDKRA